MTQMKMIVKIIQTFPPPPLVISPSRFPLSTSVSFLMLSCKMQKKKAHNGMGLTSCVRAEICQLWQLQFLTGQGQKLPKRIEEMVESHLFQFILVIE